MSKSNKPYYCLIAKEDGDWAIQFGDYDRETVQQEGEDLAYSGDWKRKDWKVICGSDADAIDLCHALNNKTALSA